MKSFLGLVLLLSLSSATWGQAPQPPAPKSQQVGRYQLYQPPSLPGEKFLLDTATGKVWTLVTAPDGTKFWEPVDRVDNFVEEVAHVKKHQKQE